MAEFCLKCFNEINDMHLGERDVVLSKYDDLCEGCSQPKRVVVRLRGNSILWDFVRWMFRMR